MGIRNRLLYEGEEEELGTSKHVRYQRYSTARLEVLGGMRRHQPNIQLGHTDFFARNRAGCCWWIVALRAQKLTLETNRETQFSARRLPGTAGQGSESELASSPLFGREQTERSASPPHNASGQLDRISRSHGGALHSWT